MRILPLASAETLPDPVALYVVPLILALLGIVGISVGAWITARSELRSRLIDMIARDAEAERAFGVRAVSAVSELGIASHHVVEDLLQRGRVIAEEAAGTSRVVEVRFDMVLTERVSAATEAWRKVLAEAHFYSSGPLADAFYAFDQQRDLIVRSVNVASGPAQLEKALEECVKLREDFSGQIFRWLQIAKVQGHARTYRLAHVRRLRHLAKTVEEALQAEIDGALETDMPSKSRAGS